MSFFKRAGSWTASGEEKYIAYPHPKPIEKKAECEVIVCPVRDDVLLKKSLTESRSGAFWPCQALFGCDQPEALWLNPPASQ